MWVCIETLFIGAKSQDAADYSILISLQIQYSHSGNLNVTKIHFNNFGWKARENLLNAISARHLHMKLSILMQGHDHRCKEEFCLPRNILCNEIIPNITVNFKRADFPRTPVSLSYALTTDTPSAISGDAPLEWLRAKKNVSYWGFISWNNFVYLRQVVVIMYEMSTHVL